MTQGDQTLDARSRLAGLYAAEADRVYGFLLARCGSPSLAEELTAQTFENAARVCATGRGDNVTPSWLLTVGRRRLIDHWRSSSRAERKLAAAGAELLTNPLETGATPATTDRDRIVMAALDSLSPKQRAALALRYLDDFAVSEVAEALGMSYRAAESLLARSRRAFKTAYGEHS